VPDALTFQHLDPQRRALFESHVHTRYAALLCDVCRGQVRDTGLPSGYTAHFFDRVEIVRGAMNAVTSVAIIFRCADCGAPRVWGQIGPYPERPQPPEAPEDDPDTEDDEAPEEPEEEPEGP